MLKLLGNFAKGIAKKKVKKKGAEMAQNMMGSKKEKDNSSAIVVREKKTTLAPMSSGGALDTPIQKPTTEGSPLDRIDSALLDIINTLKGRRKLMLDKSRKMRQQADKEKKGKREGVLENVKNMGKKMVGDVVATASGWWEKLQRFLLMTLLGSLVVAIKENWEAIKVQIDKVVNFVQDLWKFMSPILVPLFDALKWVTVEGFKLIGNMLGMGKDKAQIDKGTDEVSDGLNKIKEKTSMLTNVFKKTDKDVRSLEDTKKGEVEGKTPPLPKTNRDEKTTEKTVSGRFDMKTGKGYINDQEVAMDEYEKFANMSMKEKVNQYGQVKENPQYNVGGYVTRDGEVHQGEYVVKESIVKKVGVTSIENVIKTMMQTSTTNIKQNPLKVISIMEGMSKQFAPIGEQLPEMINETIKESKLGTVSKKITKEMIEKMENTLTVLKEQTDYEEQSGNTLIISAPKPSRPSVSGGGGGTKVIPIGESGKTALNRYVNAVIQKTLY